MTRNPPKAVSKVNLALGIPNNGIRKNYVFNPDDSVLLHKGLRLNKKKVGFISMWGTHCTWSNISQFTFVSAKLINLRKLNWCIFQREFFGAQLYFPLKRHKSRMSTISKCFAFKWIFQTPCDYFIFQCSLRNFANSDLSRTHHRIVAFHFF